MVDITKKKLTSNNSVVSLIFIASLVYAFNLENFLTKTATETKILPTTITEALPTTEPELKTEPPEISPETIMQATEITFHPGPYLADIFDFENNKFNNFSPEKFRMQQPEQFLFYEKLKDRPEISWSKNTCRKNDHSTVSSKKIVYLKVHKTGSTGIRNNFDQYCRFHNFTIYSKKGGMRHLGGYPAPFNATAHLHKLQSKVDCLVDHLRWNKPEMVKVLKNYQENESHIFIGSIREPLAHAISSFSFWYSRSATAKLLIDRYDTELLKSSHHKAYHSRDEIGFHSCDFEPYRSIFLGDDVKDEASYVEKIKAKHRKISGVQVLKKYQNENRYFNPANLTYKMMIEKMMSEPNIYPKKLFDGSLADVRKIRNLQSSEFNYLSPEDIFKQFDMIIILERIAECLVLLKQKMCVEDWNQFLPLYAISRKDPIHRKNSAGPVTEGGSGSELWDKYFPEKEQQEFIKKYLLDLDLELYRRANLKLDQEVEKFGKDRMDKLIYQNFELPYLKRLNESKYRKMKRVKRFSTEVIERRIADTSGLVLKPEIRALMDETKIRFSPEFRCGFGYNQYTKKPVEKKYYKWYPKNHVLHGTLHVDGLDLQGGNFWG